MNKDDKAVNIKLALFGVEVGLVIGLFELAHVNDLITILLTAPLITFGVAVTTNEMARRFHRNRVSWLERKTK